MKDSWGENEATDCIVTIQAQTIIDRGVCKYFIKESSISICHHLWCRLITSFREEEKDDTGLHLANLFRI